MGKKKIEPSDSKPVAAASMFGLKTAPLGSVVPSTSSEPLPELVVSEPTVVGQSPLRSGQDQYQIATPDKEAIKIAETEKKRADYLKSVDTGQSRLSSGLSELNKGLLGISSAIPEEIAILAKKYDDFFGGNKPLEDYQTYKWAKAADNWLKKTYPTNPAYQDELATQLFSGFGQALSFLAGGELGASLKLSRGASMAFMGSAQNAVPEYEASKKLAEDANSMTPEMFVQKYSADESGIPRRIAQYQQLKGQNPEDVAWDAFRYNAVIGMTEAIPFDIALTKFDKITGGGIRKYLLTALDQGSTEAFQEATAQYLSNLSAREVYDKQREVTEGLMDAAVPGFILGGILGGFGSSIANRINDPNTSWQDKAQLTAAKNELDAEIKALPSDQDEIVSKPIENAQIKDLTAKRDALEKEAVTNDKLGDETKASLIDQANIIDGQIEEAKEAAIAENTNKLYLQTNLEALESKKAEMESDRLKMEDSNRWVMDAQIDNINSKIEELKQQQNVETSQAQAPGEEAVQLLKETGSEGKGGVSEVDKPALKWQQEQSDIDGNSELSPKEKSKQKIGSTETAINSLSEDGLNNLKYKVGNFDAKTIAEKYHLYKETGSNPTLVKSVEDAIGNKSEKDVTSQSKNDNNAELEKQLPNTLSPTEKQGSIAGGETNAAATAITGAIHRAVEETGTGGKKLSPDQVIQKEETELKKYAEDNGILIKNDFGEPDHFGNEQDVYVDPDGKTVTKINDNPTHDTWNDFFHRIAIHNSLFPDVAYTLKGFSERDGRFAAVLEQPLITKGKEPVRFSEVTEELGKMGFEPSTDPNDFGSSEDYKNGKSSNVFFNKKTGVKISDLHGENVIKGADGKIHFIDPIITIDKTRTISNIEPTTKTIPNAIPEQSTNALPIQPRTTVSEGVGQKTETDQPSTTEVEPPKPPSSKKTEPKEPGKPQRKSFVNRVAESDVVKGNKKLKQAIESKGLDYDVFTHEEAKTIAEGIIETEGLNKALEIARDRNSDISGNIRTFIYGKALDHYTESQQTFSKEGNEVKAKAVAKQWSDIAGELDEYLRDSGRAIASVGDYYKSNALGIQMREINRLKRDAKKTLEKTKNVEAVKKAEKEFKEIDKKFEKKIKRKRSEGTKKNIFNRTVEERAQRIEDLKAKWNELGGKLGIANDPKVEAEKMQILVDIGAEYLASGIHNFVKWSERMIKEFGITEEQAKKVWGGKVSKDVDSKERTLSEISEQEFIEERNAEATKQKLAVLNKLFPKKPLQSNKKRLELHEKIVKAYDAGLFEGKENKEGRKFEELFYEKLGIVDPNSPEIQENIKKYAEKINKSPEGILQNEAYSEMLSYLEEQKRQSLIDTGMSIWYANILSSHETHLRNSQFNIITSLISEPLLLAQKRILKGDVKGAIKVYQYLFSDMGDAARQFKAVWRGGVSKYEKPKARSILDKFQFGKGIAGTIFSPAKYPGRALRASDAFFTSMLANAKQYEAMKRTVEKESPNLSRKEQDVIVNESLGNTTQRRVDAEEQAQKDIDAVFGDKANTKEAQSLYKLRVAEIMEQSRPKEIYEEGVNWARKALLTNEPEGMWKGVAQSLRTLGEAAWPVKLVVPFVNVPLNLADRFIERGPIGYVNALRGKKGFGGFEVELTEDQQKELLLKATNYTIALFATGAAISALNDDDDDDKNPFVITGKQTGNYLDNKGIVRGGGMEDYSVYIFGNIVMSYKYTPWAPFFAPLGYMHDYKRYGKTTGLAASLGYSAMNYLSFFTEQSSMKGLGEFLGTLDARSLEKSTPEKIGERLTSMAQSFIIPMSGLVKATNNDIRGIMGQVDKVGTDWWDPILRDIPIAEEMMENRGDHLGRDIKEVFDMPLLPEGLAIKETNDPYYKLFNEKSYFPNFYANRTIFIDNEESEMSKKDLYKLNKYRGQYALDILKTEDVLPGDEEGDRSTLEYLRTLDKEDFKKEMNEVFSIATKRAKLKMFGTKWALKKYDLMKESDINKYEEFKMDLGEE